MGLDREWARDRANEWVEDYIEQAERGSLTRDRHVGHHMRVFDLTEDEIDGAEDLDFHVYAPDNTASEELADAILEYRARSAVDSFGDLDSPRYAYADAEEVRERIEERAEVAADEEFQSRLSEWRDDTASTDPYERLGMEWAATGDLEEYIDSFWEPDDEPDLISIDLET